MPKLPSLDFPSPDDLDTTSRGVSGLILRMVSRQLVESVRLPVQGELCIGRGERANLRFAQLNDLSRRHAMLRIGDPLELCDLASSNGTYVRGALLPPNEFVPLSLREPFLLSDTTFVVQREALEDQPTQVVGRDPIRELLEAKLASDSTTGVVRLRVDGSRDWVVCTRMLLSRTDVVGILSDQQIVLLLLHRNETQITALAAALERVLLRTGCLQHFELHVVPRDGITPATLLGVDKSNPVLLSSTHRPPPGSPSSSRVDRIVVSPSMIKLYELAGEVAAAPTSLLLLGETGAGKDVLARSVHERSPRNSAPFVGINCAALPENLLESELFGYEKGAFTGAVAAKPGLLESAEGGTVFLDEVGEMPASIQAKLLRVLEEHQVLRIGALKLRPVDFRLIAATNRNLHTEMAAGRFRSDLYYRINGLSLHVPPLRERQEEIAPLVAHFAQRAAETFAKPVPAFSPNALKLLMQYGWPGNIRELRNVVQRAVLLCRGSEITAEYLAQDLGEPSQPSDDFAVELTQPRPIQPSLEVEPPPPTGQGTSLQDELTAIESRRIVDALEACAGNQTRAAQMLGMTRRAFIVRLNRYNIRRPRRGR